MSAISYNKLWKLLIDKRMNKKDLRLAAGVSTAVIASLEKAIASRLMFCSKYAMS